MEQIVDLLGRGRNNLELACSTEERDSSPTDHFFASFFLFVNEFLGVMRVQPVQRLIALGNRRYHLSTACLAASRGALLQRASSSTHERHRLRVHDHRNVPSQEELELFCELAGLARVQARLSLHKSREFFSGLEVGGLPS